MERKSTASIWTTETLQGRFFAVPGNPLIMLLILRAIRFAPIVYTAEGRQMAQRLWKETMSELSFAGVEDVIEALTI